jgi:DeoR family transcriptional regulator of aga operon/DeoR family fructose operon transcriptional repressor
MPRGCGVLAGAQGRFKVDDDAGLVREPLVAERRLRIAGVIESNGGASVEELARSLSVSPSTVRRDLLWLSDHNVISRTWGGAVVPETVPTQRTEDILLSGRQKENASAKAAIAKAAAALVRDGDAIVIDAGSTTQLMAPYLLARQRLTVITTSLPLAWQLRGHANIELIVTGGHVHTRASSLVGLLAEETLSQLFADIAFIGARGLTPVNGLTNPVLEEVPMKRLMIKIARRSVALVDSDKWGRVFMGLITPVSGVNIVVTDSQVPSGMRGEVELLGTEVLVAE